MPAPRSRQGEGATPTADAREKALCCARWALEKKAHGVVLLNVGKLTPITEYFVICSGRSVRQTRAIVEHLRIRLKKELKCVPLGVEGEREGCWILLDCDDVIVHVFDEPTRELYRLERLWSDAPVLRDPSLVEEAATDEGSEEEGEEEEWED